jgi:hypothetical protein
MNELFKSTNFLFEKIRRIYPTFVRPDELDIEVWAEVLEGHSQTEILDALKKYRKTVEYNKAPTPAEFSKFLDTVSESKPVASQTQEFNCYAPAESLMTRDIELKRNRHLLTVYKLAVDYITQDLLLEIIPSSEWRKMDFSQRVAFAKKKGLFDRFDEVLVYVCKVNYGKEYQYDSESMLENAKARSGSTFEDGVNLLASQWRM